MNIRASHDIFASTVYLSNCGCNGCCIFLFRLLSLQSVGPSIRSVYSLHLTRFERLWHNKTHKRPAQKSGTKVRVGITETIPIFMIYFLIYKGVSRFSCLIGSIPVILSHWTIRAISYTLSLTISIISGGY